MSSQSPEAEAFSTSSIADKASRFKDGANGGWCMVFVRERVKEASGGKIVTSAYTYGYQGTFKAKGAKQISSAHAGRGDIIQVTPFGTADAWDGGGEVQMPLHTAIILRNLGGGNFQVIDSNFSNPMDFKVRRHYFNPYTWSSRKYGARTVRIWRFGTAKAQPAKKPAPKSTLKPKPQPPAPASRGDSTGAYFPWDMTFHLSDGLATGSSNYIFEKGSSLGSARSIPLTGDWNGDGRTSTGAYFPWDQTMHLSDGLVAGPSNYIFGHGSNKNGVSSIPLVGDWNGDGRDSVGSFFPWDLTMHLRDSLSAGPSDYIFAHGGNKNGAVSIPIVGDWDGDGKDSVGAFFPWDQTMHLRNSLSAGPSDYIFKSGGRLGVKSSIPIAGDWNADGKDSVGHYFPWDYTMHLRNALSAGPSDVIYSKGGSLNGVDAIPVVGNWDGK